MRDLVEAIHRRTKTFQIFCRSRRGQRRQRAAVERAFEGDDAVTFRMPLGEVMMADQLDHALQRLGAGIAEEHEVRKTLMAEAVGELLAIRALEQVRHVPELRGLLLQRFDQRGMGMAERVHRDTRGEIEIALAIGRNQPAAFAALETEVGSGENGEQMRRCAVGHDVTWMLRTV
ncbi:hypothetical protein ACVWZZ_005069 [Bradyrhizobium sp. LM6.10]